MHQRAPERPGQKPLLLKASSPSRENISLAAKALPSPGAVLPLICTRELVLSMPRAIAKRTLASRRTTPGTDRIRRLWGKWRVGGSQPQPSRPRQAGEANINMVPQSARQI
jgi:hypothetical protein